MQFNLISNEGVPLDAHFSTEDGDLIFHSRGGTKGTPSQRNADYAEGLALLIARLKNAGVGIQGIWVDSSVAKKLPLSERSIFDKADADLPVERLFQQISSKMKSVGRSENARKPGGNTDLLPIESANLG